MSIPRILDANGCPICSHCGVVTAKIYRKRHELECWKCGKKFGPNVVPNSMWLVVIECRYDVIRISPDGKGLFIPGQEPCWHLDHVAEWVREIHPPCGEDALSFMNTW